MILERDSELVLLASLVDQAAEGRGRVVLVRGEAGIGKSTLINRFLFDVADRAHTLIGECDDLLTPQPFGPLWDVARDEASLVEPLRDGDRRQVWEITRDLLSRSLRPTVLVLEDTQWADEATLDLITYLGRRIATTHGVLVLTYRDAEVYADHPLRQVIGDLPLENLVRIPLKRLSLDAIESMITDDQLDASNVYELTGGNPLFVREVLVSGTDGVPTSVTDTTLARMSGLSPQARQILELVSVAPGEIERSIVEAVLEPAPGDFSECVRKGLLRVGTSAISFPHDLQRRAVESSLSETERKQRNKQILTALGPKADPARLVHHANEAGDISGIVKFGPLAAAAAVSAESRRDAVSHFETLDPHLSQLDVASQASILMDWGDQSYLLGDPQSVDILERCIALRREIGKNVDLARTLTIACRVNATHANPERAIAYADEAVALLEPNGPSSDLARAYAFRSFLAFYYFDSDDLVLPDAEKAFSMAEAVGDETAALDALNSMAHLRYSRGEAGGLTLMEDSLERSIRIGDHVGEVRALSNMAGMYGDARHVARAIDFAQRARNTAARYEMHGTETDVLTMHAEFLLWSGDWAAAEDMAALGLRGGGRNTSSTASRVLSTIQARRGRREAGAAVREMWADVPPGQGATVHDTAAAAVAEYLWLSGDDEPEILGRLKEILDDGLSLGVPWPSGAMAFWMWKLGFLDKAPAGSADFYGWIIDGEYKRAAEFWRDRGIPYEEGLALMHGDQTEQIEALRIFDKLGAAAIADKVRNDLAEQGVRVPRGKARETKANVAGLTGRQSEVLGYLADGLTNIEIAEELFVSHRTIENHVSAILMKLDVPNRERAVETAHDQGLLQTS